MMVQPLLTLTANAQEGVEINMTMKKIETKGFVEKTVDVNGETMSYQIKGGTDKKGTLVYVHGSIFNKDAMLPVAHQTKNDYQIVNIDLPGHGESTGEARTSVESYADIVYDTIKELIAKGEITDNVSVAGWSLGGNITLELALRDLPEIKSSIMIDSSAKFDIPEIPREVYDTETVISMAYTDLTTEKSKEYISDIIKHNSEDTDTCLLDLRVASSYDARDRLQDVKIPVLVVAGDKDALAPVEMQQFLAETIPNGELALIEGYGHALVMENPRLIADQINNFLK